MLHVYPNGSLALNYLNHSIHQLLPKLQTTSYCSIVTLQGVCEGVY